VVFRNVFRNHRASWLDEEGRTGGALQGARITVGCVVFKDHPSEGRRRAGLRVAKRRGLGHWPAPDQGPGPPLARVVADTTTAAAFRRTLINPQGVTRQRCVCIAVVASIVCDRRQSQTKVADVNRPRPPRAYTLPPLKYDNDCVQVSTHVPVLYSHEWDRILR